MIKKILLFAGFCAFLFASINSFAAVPIGTALAVSGKVYAEDAAGNRRQLQRHDKIYLNEIIITEANSKAQLKLNDDSLFALSPSTKYTVNEFSFNKKNVSSNRYVGSLVEGALITISGQAKSVSHENYLLKTPVATIATRGTFYESGFKTSQDKQAKDQCAESAGKILGYGWNYVALGAVNIKPNKNQKNTKQVCDINAKDPKHNACFYKVCGTLGKKAEFQADPKATIEMKATDERAMRNFVSGQGTESSTKGAGWQSSSPINVSTPTDTTSGKESAANELRDVQNFVAEMTGSASDAAEYVCVEPPSCTTPPCFCL